MSKVHNLPKSALPLNRYQGMSPQEIRHKQERQLQKAAKMYETQFLNTMVQAMRKTVMKGGFQQESYAEKIYKDQLFDKYVQSWGNQGGIGIGDLIYKQLHEKIFPDHSLRVPKGPIQVNPRETFEVPKSEDGASPIFHLKKQESSDGVSFIFQRNKNLSVADREVSTPWEGEVVKSFQAEGRNNVFIQHKNGLTSHISFQGEVLDLGPGTKVGAGQKLGQLSEESKGLAWKIKS